MSKENPNVGKQFEDIMGANFTPQDEEEMAKNATFGEDSSSEIEGETTALSRFHDFPKSMIHYNEENGYHVSLTTPRGWTHIWKGGPYIEHQSSPGNSEDLTNMHDYSKPADQQSYSKGISLPTFLGHVNEFEKYAEDNFPDEHKPPKR